MIRRALTNTGWLMGARGINAALSLVYLALATRALGLEGFGAFTLVTTFALAITGICQFQTWQAVVQWGHREGQESAAVGFALALDALSMVAGVIAAALLLGLAGDWLPVPAELRWHALAYTAITLVSMRSTPTGILRLHDRYARAAVADSVTSIIRVIGAGVVFVLAPDVASFLLVWAVAEVATALAYWRYALSEGPLSLDHVSVRQVPARDRSAWPFVFGTALSGMLLVASRQIIVLLVGAIGGVALAGIYRVAAQLGEGLLKLAQAILKATYPELVRDPSAARHVASRIGRIALYTGIVAVAVAAVLGRPAIALVAGPEYLAAYLPMILLSVAAACELAGATLEALLVSRGMALRNFLLRGVPTLGAVAALFWVVPHWGVDGAAALVLVASVLTVGGLVATTRRLDAAGR
jgi:O-antigen/teichoic acid export membrane protein